MKPTDLKDIEAAIAEHTRQIGELSHAAAARIAATNNIKVGTRIRWTHGQDKVDGIVNRYAWKGYGDKLDVYAYRILADGTESKAVTTLRWQTFEVVG